MLNFGFCQGGQIGAETYDFRPIDINELKDSTDVLEKIQSQCGNLEPEKGLQGYLWHNLATSPLIECHLGHIPVTVVAWRKTEMLQSMIYHLTRGKAPPYWRRTAGKRTSSVEVICRVDASRIPPHHPKIFDSTSLSSSIVRRLRTFGKTAANRNPSCQSQYSIAQCPTSAEDKTSHLVLGVSSCTLILLFLIVFLALSLFLGIFFTMNKSYGNSMGDAWTLASYVIGVGGACASVLGICHYPHCTCWRGSKKKTCTE